MMSETKRRSQAHFEWPLLVAMYALSLFGLLCITMATYDIGLSGDAPLLNKILNSRSGMWQSIFILVSPIIVFVIMAIPTEISNLLERINTWVDDNMSVLDSPYQSESFGGYSYSKASGNASNGDGNITWQSHFANELNRWRKIRP